MFNSVEGLDKYFANYPVVLVDVGFRGGIQGKWLAVKKYLQVIGFEPDKTEFDSLIENLPTNTNTIYNVALYKEQRDDLDLFITRDGNLCSIFEPDRNILDDFPETERFDLLKKVQVKADTLDNVLKNSNIGCVDFIKVDTQGSELFVLEGAKSILERSVFGVEVEVEFLPMYKNQPLFDDVNKFMRERGFYLFDLKKHYWRRKCGLGFDGSLKGQIIHGDALYLRNVDHYLNILNPHFYSPDQIKAIIFKAIAICGIFNYSDYAVYICHKARQEKIISSQEAEQVFRLIKKGRKKIDLLSFPGKGKIFGMLKFLSSIAQENHHGWATRDKQDVGNRV